MGYTLLGFTRAGKKFSKQAPDSIEKEKQKIETTDMYLYMKWRVNPITWHAAIHVCISIYIN